MNLSRQAGFTLLEMLMVTAVVVVLLSMVLVQSPRWGARTRLEAAALRVEALVNQARADAAAYGAPVTIRLYNENSHGRIMAQTAAAQSQANAALPENITFAPALDSAAPLFMVFYPGGDSAVSTNNIPDPSRRGATALYPLALYHDRAGLSATVNVYRAAAARLAAPPGRN